MIHRFLLLSSFAAACTASFAETQIWVSPRGKDTDSGSRAAPVQSIQKAVELVRKAAKSSRNEAVRVMLEPGDYPVTETLELGPQDSGKAEAPVIWESAEPGKARIIGAKTVTPNLFERISDETVLSRLDASAAPNVVEIDAAKLGVKLLKDLPDFNREDAVLPMVFMNSTVMPNSRWPNGQYGYTTMVRVLNSGSFKSKSEDGGTFEYAGERPARWLKALEDSGVWIRGFWRVPWVAETIRVEAIDTAAKTITLKVSTSMGIGSKYSQLVGETRTGDGKENWFALNLVEEIDQPGEWAVDFKRRKIYFWPPSQEGATYSIADNKNPMLLMRNAEFVSFRNIVMGQQMGKAVSIEGGKNVSLLGCTIQGIGDQGVLIRGGSNHEIRSCDFMDINLAAIDVLGGDRKTLTPCGHKVINNLVKRVALASPTPAVIFGLDARTQDVVGCTVAYNRIHDTSYGGITFGGNDNLFEYNEIYRVGLDGGDLGCFYVTGGWTCRGNVVRHNFLHHSENANAIYMDDGACGVRMEGNLVYRAESGIFIGGGHDNIARNNVVVGSERAVHIDDRGIARKYLPTDSRLRRDLDSVPYQSSPWKERFPEMVNILETDTSVPQRNVIENNVFINNHKVIRPSFKEKTSAAGFRTEPNVEVSNPAALVNVKAMDFRPTEAFAAQLRGVTALYLPMIVGIQVDEYRTRVEPRDLELLNAETTKRKHFDSQQDVDAYNKKN